MSSDQHLAQLLKTIAPLRRELVTHGLYDAIQSKADVQNFAQQHVFAVWDFMSLLKALQRALTCTTVPWVPKGSPHLRRLINEIVLQEESDEVDGVVTGHFELYLRAMRQIGASTKPIEALLGLLARGEGLDASLRGSGASPGAIAFVRATFSVIESRKPHMIAAAFTFGREDSIPAMFRRVTESVERQANDGDHGDADLLRLYIDRHMELDEDDHGPKAIAMVCELCGTDPVLWHEAAEAASEALKARLAFWTAIAEDIGAGVSAADEMGQILAFARRPGTPALSCVDA